MSRNLKFAINEYYHLYNRGTDKRVVFEDNDDYLRFTQLLYLCNDENNISIRRNRITLETLSDLMMEDIESPVVAIGSYCLMPNHFHILVKEISEKGISKFMHKLSTAYTMYFNNKYDRNGVLFQGRFKATHLDSDEYLKYIFSYIHLNPVKLIDSDWKENGLKNKLSTLKFLNSYIYSSYLDFVGIERLTTKLLNRIEFPEYFPDHNSFNECIENWLDFKTLYEG